MFRKKITIKPLAPLRSSDRRKLADQIINDYGVSPPANVTENTQQPKSDSSDAQDPSVSPEQQKADATAAHTALRNALLPENTQAGRFTTTQGAEGKVAGGTLYVGGEDGGRVLWFSLEGRLFPSIYTLWRHPRLVPLLHTPALVISKLTGGADLMTPGLARGPPFPSGAVTGAVVAIAGLDRPSVPLVIGVCEIDVSALQAVAGAKGHAVRNLHWVGDEVWGYGATGRAGQATLEEIEGWDLDNGAGPLSQGVENLQVNGDEGEQDDRNGGGVSLEMSGEVDNKDDQNDSLFETVQPKEFSPQEIDDAFRNAFLFGVYKHKSSNAGQPNFGLVFPLSPSFVMSSLINPFLPAFTPEQEKQLQIKKTSWKNLKKFIKSLDKQQIIKSKDKDGNETVILDIDFDDSAIVNFQPYRLPKKEAASSSFHAQGERTNDAADSAVGQRLQILSYYKPTARLSPLFASSDKQLLTSSEVRETVTAYIESENLISETNKRLIRLNPILANAVFDGTGALDKEVIAKGSVPRDALLDRVLHGMNSSYAILRNDADPSASKPRSGPPAKIHITLETRSGNKTVTKVSGLEPFFVHPRLLADELRKTCAGSTSVEPLAGAAKKTEKPVEEVMVQGPQKDAVIKALERRGVDRRWVEILDKTKGKKR